MANGFNLEQLRSDVVVGRMVDGALQTQVSVRGDKIVVGYFNTIMSKGFELTYSVKAVQQFNDILALAAKVATGKG